MKQNLSNKLASFLLKHLFSRQSELEAFLLDQLDIKLFVPPGHFYSPIPSLDYVRQHEDQIFGPASEYPLGIDLRKEDQFSLLQTFKNYYDELPFADEKKGTLRYYYNNPAYSYSDAFFLYSMIRHVRPRKIIEVGSGYSSCIMLDVNELYFENSIDVTFVEPYPELLLSLIKERDRDRINLISKNLQEIDLGMFETLTAGDILFIDSSHVVKIFSDVNYLLSEILPRLANGVYIHFHDIFYPFEYPKRWIYENRAWNELYFLKAFLQYNSIFQIIIHNRYLEFVYKDYFEQQMPLCTKNLGASIWLRKNNP
ncbi:MAG: class I SAM-dependent methyltransferase [Anaerolineales bacterium]